MHTHRHDFSNGVEYSDEQVEERQTHLQDERVPEHVDNRAHCERYTDMSHAKAHCTLHVPVHTMLAISVTRRCTCRCSWLTSENCAHDITHARAHTSHLLSEHADTKCEHEQRSAKELMQRLVRRDPRHARSPHQHSEQIRLNFRVELIFNINSEQYNKQCCRRAHLRRSLVPRGYIPTCSPYVMTFTATHTATASLTLACSLSEF
jgi:hypothetical protein